MKCANCGEENPEGATFCQNCGNEIPKAEPKPKVTTPPRAEPEKPPERGKSNKMLLVVGVVVILIAAIGIYYASTQNFFAPVSPQNSTVWVVNTVSGKIAVLNETYEANDVMLGYGSGFIITNDGYIATAAHVISDPVALESEGKIVKMDDTKIKFYLARAAAYEYLKKYNPSTLNTMTIAQLNQITTESIALGQINVTNGEQNVYILGPAL